MLAGLNAVYFIDLSKNRGNWGPQEDAPLTAKIAAASAMLLWVGVMYYGSMLPFYRQLILGEK